MVKVGMASALASAALIALVGCSAGAGESPVDQDEAVAAASEEGCRAVMDEVENILNRSTKLQEDASVTPVGLAQASISMDGLADELSGLDTSACQVHLPELQDSVLEMAEAVELRAEGLGYLGQGLAEINPAFTSRGTEMLQESASMLQEAFSVFQGEDGGIDEPTM